MIRVTKTTKRGAIVAPTLVQFTAAMECQHNITLLRKKIYMRYIFIVFVDIYEILYGFTSYFYTSARLCCAQLFPCRRSSLNLQETLHKEPWKTTLTQVGI